MYCNSGLHKPEEDISRWPGRAQRMDRMEASLAQQRHGVLIRARGRMGPGKGDRAPSWELCRDVECSRLTKCPQLPPKELIPSDPPTGITPTKTHMPGGSGEGLSLECSLSS